MISYGISMLAVRSPAIRNKLGTSGIPLEALATIKEFTICPHASYERAQEVRQQEIRSVYRGA